MLWFRIRSMRKGEMGEARMEEMLPFLLIFYLK